MIELRMFVYICILLWIFSQMNKYLILDTPEHGQNLKVAKQQNVFYKNCRAFNFRIGVVLCPKSIEKWPNHYSFLLKLS
jgi:hypothetical protein